MATTESQTTIFLCRVLVSAANLQLVFPHEDRFVMVEPAFAPIIPADNRGVVLEARTVNGKSAFINMRCIRAARLLRLMAARGPDRVWSWGGYQFRFVLE